MEHYRAHSLFQPSNLAEAIASTIDDSGACKSHLYGSIMSFPHTVVARTVSVLGFDFVMVDALHTFVPHLHATYFRLRARIYLIYIF